MTRWQHLALAAALILLLVACVEHGYPVRAVIGGTFAAFNIAAALWPIDRNY